MRKHLFTEDGKLRSFVNVYVNDEDIRYLEKENTPTKDGDTISIVPSIAGGTRDCTTLKTWSLHGDDSTDVRHRSKAAPR